MNSASFVDRGKGGAADPPSSLEGNRRIRCTSCALARFCLPKGLSKPEIDTLDGLITRSRPLRRDEHLFGMNDSCHHLYAVRSGAIKTSAVSPNGKERIVGFHLPGELVGLDALDDGRHSCTAIAVEPTTLCQFPFRKLQELSAAHARINAQFHRLIGESIAQSYEMLLLLGKKSAEERVAAFLLNLSARCARRGFSPLELNLSMSRRDISNYLGLALGTVSRLLGDLQDKKVLAVRKRWVRILDMDYLQAIVA